MKRHISDFLSVVVAVCLIGCGMLWLDSNVQKLNYNGSIVKERLCSKQVL
jgi:hypothetical protein